MNHIGASHAIQPPHPDAVKSDSQPQLLLFGGAHQEATLIAVPTYRDVLTGRGQGAQRHPGNVIFRALVFANKVRRSH